MKTRGKTGEEMNICRSCRYVNKYRGSGRAESGGPEDSINCKYQMEILQIQDFCRVENCVENVYNSMLRTVIRKFM